MNSTAPAIDVRDLRKHYPNTPDGTGLSGVDLHVPAGGVHALLGPNGAGKTTTIRILTTLLRADSGTARVTGFDVRTQGRQVRRRIGLVGQAAAVDEVLTGRQNLLMLGRLNHLCTAADRAGALLDRFGLTDAADRRVSTYSGGMRRRLDLAAALVVDPPVLFVDEPTTGLDPAGRRDVWAAIGDLVTGGTTVLLTTQYLEEADALAGQITMLAAGRVVARGTPDELKARVGGDWLEITPADPAELPRYREIAARVGEPVDRGGGLAVPVVDRTRALVTVSAALAEAGLDPLDLSVRRPTLDEAFLQLTGPASTPPATATAGPTVDEVSR
ncbi:daunorubicin/doxorubicin resistance ABC transporter ATP-binding protein DrrA [Nakamurella multipartita]|jgi:ABC-2 type transport system ATP-binding protein|uniref:Daunorubicin resistance ABC transporter ATPase subunit n=1 Tax=Nakamurella multipartita (strain ATCC 700099 / DSM 44233 / CIP 104796 / JCM 9543 / NBRC 105858 / Y-104) TaxID=479431 RepID=C8XAE2_NAKMY|nr:daunorubicin/doxorubicin resistance ABC transporter ATP-binding protein DrrA [Nakamurella multipartita]ACV77307.1 daunorubicin resistance ABC transporter ATPase subunit [Nakamurella multipartita DSM 44233]HOZ58966.1 daunorubicin/doxorubicin resistance ABC transporter ATP-binding protein DrrA [Nakamurella multipartita]